MTRAAALLALVLVAAPAYAAPPDASARVFVEHLYQSYSQPDSPPVLGKRADKLFAPKLLAAIRADQTRHDGDVGKLDHDPICDCQDPDGLKPLNVKMTKLPDSQAEASVRFKLGQSVKALRLHLVTTQHGWRIADIATPATSSLQAFLTTP